MVSLLKTMRSYATARDNVAITELLETIEDEKPKSHDVIPTPVSDNDAYDSPADNDFEITHHTVDPGTKRLNSLDDNLHADGQVRAVGFIGMSSEVRWLQLVAAIQLQRADETNPTWQLHPYASYKEPTSSFYFWTNHESVSTVDSFLNPHELPPLVIAEKLVSCYMDTVHDSFPIMSRRNFETQLHHYYTALQKGNPPRLSPKWQANLNLVFAISARHLFLIKAPGHTNERDYRVYQARAETSYVASSLATGLADVAETQGLALLALFYTCVGQVNRAWIIIGTALRSAYALGLHLRNEDPSARPRKKERLLRIWWSLYSLESLLSTLTGRPSMIVDWQCSAPLPFPGAEEWMVEELENVNQLHKEDASSVLPNHGYPIHLSGTLRAAVGPSFTETISGSYFRATSELRILAQDTNSSLYSAAAAARSSEEIQQITTQLLHRLDQWMMSLPKELDFQRPITAMSSEFARERMLLSFQLCSVRMVLARPCFSVQVQGRSPMETHHTSFAGRMDTICMKAAQAIVDFLPDEPNAPFIYSMGPWWCIVHHLMQAASIFLLRMSWSHATHATPQNSMSETQSLRKICQWLYTLDDAVAQRAWQMIAKRLNRLAQ